MNKNNLAKIDYLTGYREERALRVHKEMQPFRYGNLVKSVLEKPKYPSLSRTYLTHLAPADVYSLAENYKSKQQAKEASEKSKQQVIAIKRLNLKMEDVRKDIKRQIDQLLLYLIRVR